MSAPVRVPRLTSRSALTWVIGTVMVAVVVIGYLWVTQPENRWAAAVVLALVVLGVLAVTGSRQWLDVEARTITWQRFWLVRATVAMPDVTEARFTTTRVGSVLLSLRAGGRRRHLLVLILSPYVHASQTAEVCSAMAELVAATPTPGAVPDQLRSQARSLESGTPVERSPLASRAGARRTSTGGRGSR